MKALKYLLPVVITLLAMVFLYVSLMKVADSGGTEVTLPSQLIERPLPVFSLVDLNSQQTIVNDNLLGQKYLLNVWATWCVSCAQEHPMLNQLKAQNVRIIGLNYKDDNDKALQWLRDKGDPYWYNLVDSEGQYALDLGVTGAPETFFIDSAGIVRHKLTGLVTANKWSQQLQRIYEEMP